VSTLEKIQKHQPTISLFFATVLLIPFQLLLLFSSEAVLVLSFIDITPLILFLFGYFVMTIVYCSIASLVFHPKRIVSPVNIQVGTAVTFSIIQTYIQYSAVQAIKPMSAYETLTFIGNQAGNFLLVTLILIVIGITQLSIVKWVIGLNFDGIDRASFSINGKVKDIIKILDTEFLTVHGFNRRKDNPRAKNPIWVLKRWDVNGNFVILTIGTHMEDEDKTILASTAFRRSDYGISKNNIASAMRDSIINDIKVRLEASTLKLIVTKIEGVDDFVSLKAYSHSLAPTLSKIEIAEKFFREIPRHHLYSIIITFVALFAVVVAFVMHLLDTNTFIGVFVAIILALIAELGIAVREEMSRKEIEEID